MPPSPRSEPSGSPVSAASTPAWASPEFDQQIIDSFIADDGVTLGALAPEGVTEALIRERARTLGLTKEFVKKCRRGGSRPAMRVCMKCDQRFLSSGIHNRLCQRCPPR
jgi:hypothetical protein